MYDLRYITPDKLAGAKIEAAKSIAKAISIPVYNSQFVYADKVAKGKVDAAMAIINSLTEAQKNRGGGKMDAAMGIMRSIKDDKQAGLFSKDPWYADPENQSLMGAGVGAAGLGYLGQRYLGDWGGLAGAAAGGIGGYSAMKKAFPYIRNEVLPYLQDGWENFVE